MLTRASVPRTCGHKADSAWHAQHTLTPADAQCWSASSTRRLGPRVSGTTACASRQLAAARPAARRACICRCSALRSPNSAAVCASTSCAPSALTTRVISSIAAWSNCSTYLRARHLALSAQPLQARRCMLSFTLKTRLSNSAFRIKRLFALAAPSASKGRQQQRWDMARGLGFTEPSPAQRALLALLARLLLGGPPRRGRGYLRAKLRGVRGGRGVRVGPVQGIRLRGNAGRQLPRWRMAYAPPQGGLPPALEQTTLKSRSLRRLQAGNDLQRRVQKRAHGSCGSAQYAL